VKGAWAVISCSLSWTTRQTWRSVGDERRQVLTSESGELLRGRPNEGHNAVPSLSEQQKALCRESKSREGDLRRVDGKRKKSSRDEAGASCTIPSPLELGFASYEVKFRPRSTSYELPELDGALLHLSSAARLSKISCRGEPAVTANDCFSILF
jgi:hypothetical protein